MPRLLVPPPSKGMMADAPLGQDKAAETLEGFWLHGKLRSMEGRLLQAMVPHALGQTDGTFGNHYVYHASDGSTYVVARNGNYIWLGIPHSTVVVSSSEAAHTLTVTNGDIAVFPKVGYLLLAGHTVVSYSGWTDGATDYFSGCSSLPTLVAGDTVSWVDWRPLWGDTGTGGYAARTVADEGFQQVNTILYFGNGTDVPGRWNGFEYHGATSATSKLVSVSGTTLTCSDGTMDFTAAGVSVGDSIYFRYETATPQKSEWDLDDGRLITAVGTTTLTISESVDTAFTGKGPSAGNAVEYQIVRCSQVGVPAASTGSDASGLIDDPVGSLVDGTYQYSWRYVSNSTDGTGYAGAMSDPSEVTITDEGSVLFLGSWDTTKPEPHITGVEIWSSSMIGDLTTTTGTAGTDEITWTCTAPGATSGNVGIALVLWSQDGGATYFKWLYLKIGESGSWPAVFDENETADDMVAYVNAHISDRLTCTTSDSGIVAVFDRHDLIATDTSAWAIRTTLDYTATGSIDGMYTDGGETNLDAYTLEADYAYYVRPAATTIGEILRYHADRIMTVPSTSTGALRFSTQADHEYFPTSRTGVYGGSITVSSDAIVDIVDEGASYDIAGRAGHALIGWTRTMGFRLYGTDWTDDAFKVDWSFPIGAAAMTGQNILGNVLWLSPDGPMRLPVGSQEPIPIYKALWPYGMKTDLFSATADQPALLANWRAAAYGEYYVLTGSNGSAYKIYAYHVPTDSWVTLPLTSAVNSLAVWTGTNEIGQLTGAEDSYLYRLFAGCDTALSPLIRTSYWTPKVLTGTAAAGQAAKWVTGPVLPDPSDGFVRYAKIYRVTARFRSPYAAQAVVMKIYADGDLTTAVYTSSSTAMAADTSVTGERAFASWYPEARGTQFNLELAGTFTVPVEFEGLEIEYTLQERVK